MANSEVEVIEELQDGKLLLFQRNKIYQARIYVGDRRYIFKSLKTKDIEQARSEGTRLFYELQYKQREGMPLQSKTFNEVIAEYVAMRQLDYDRNKDKVNTSYRQTTSIYMLRQIKRVVKFWQAYRGNVGVDKIDNAKLQEYVQWRKNYYFEKQRLEEKIPRNARMNPADKTLEWEITLAKSLLKFAFEKGYRGNTQLPTYRFKAEKKIVRPTFALSEYWQIIIQMRKRIKEEKNKERKYIKETLRDYVLILANSGMRVGEANNLKTSDIEEFKDSKGNKNYLFNVKGKTGKRVVIPRTNCVRYVERVMARNKERKEEEKNNKIREVQSPKRKLQDRDDWFFCMYDGNKVITLIDQFKMLLKSIGLEKNRYGEFYTLYSLRHFYATRMLLKGRVNIFDIARNMGTSVEIIQSYYGKSATSMELATRLGGG